MYFQSFSLIDLQASLTNMVFLMYHIYCYFHGCFHKTIFPLTLVGYEMVMHYIAINHFISNNSITFLGVILENRPLCSIYA